MLALIYLRRVPSPTPGRFDVVAYTNETATDPVARWDWHLTTKPTRRNKSVNINCVRRPVPWLADA